MCIVAARQGELFKHREFCLFTIVFILVFVLAQAMGTMGIPFQLHPVISSILTFSTCVFAVLIFLKCGEKWKTRGDRIFADFNVRTWKSDYLITLVLCGLVLVIAKVILPKVNLHFVSIGISVFQFFCHFSAIQRRKCEKKTFSQFSQFRSSQQTLSRWTKTTN